MGNHLVKDRVQRYNAIEERWELYDVIEERVVARNTHKWHRVRMEGAPVKRGSPRRREVLEAVA